MKPDRIGREPGKVSSMKNTNADWVIKARVAHWDALKAMLPGGDTRSGLHVWRQLRRLECKAGALALRLCNGPEMSEDDQEKVKAQVTAGVEKVFGYLPKGFFINLDPRGWALKLESGSVPHKLHQDWGGYQILAPLIEG
jgi:hypothetical protein